MKCLACGYKYQELKETEIGVEYLSDGTEDFVKIFGPFKAEAKGWELTQAKLYACPKCGTVRMDKW